MAAHLVAIAVSLGESATFGAFLAGVVGFAQIPGRILLGLAGDRIRAKQGPYFALAGIAIGLVLLATTTQVTVVGVLSYGMGVGP